MNCYWLHVRCIARIVPVFNRLGFFHHVILYSTVLLILPMFLSSIIVTFLLQLHELTVLDLLASLIEGVCVHFHILYSHSVKVWLVGQS